MDLFNPEPNYNYIIMDKKIENLHLENPFIQVVWEDFAENFTQEKIKSVRFFFQKKYNSTNVNVITKTKQQNQNDVQSVDISLNILDKNYQIELVKDFLNSKSSLDNLEQILQLDESVNNKIILNQNEISPFKKWYIKNIEFSNFLS